MIAENQKKEQGWLSLEQLAFEMFEKEINLAEN